MLEVASVSTELQHLNVKLYHQDAVTALDIPQCDLAISDLPIGYYPLDENAKNYQTRAKEGHSYVHHLLIEQSMNYLKPGAFGVFLVPSSLFQTQGISRQEHRHHCLRHGRTLHVHRFVHTGIKKTCS